MSISHSISTDSTSSSSNTTTPANQSNEQEMDPSNILYNDHQNYQIIFTNDSRFFDTSLHLYKSYRKLGYIPTDNGKAKKHRFPTSINLPQAQSNGHHDHVRSKSTGFTSNHEANGHDDGTLKAEISRKNDPLITQRSDLNSSKLKTLKPKHENTHDAGVSRQQKRPSSKRYDSSDGPSDDPDIIITRL